MTSKNLNLNLKDLKCVRNEKSVTPYFICKQDDYSMNRLSKHFESIKDMVRLYEHLPKDYQAPEFEVWMVIFIYILFKEISLPSK